MIAYKFHFRLVSVLAILSCFCFVEVPSLYAQAYKNATLAPEVRANDLLKRMTLEEKVAQIRHVHSGSIFDGQTLNEKKLHEFVGDRCWGFVEDFPLTAENSHKEMRHVQEYMMKHTRLGIPIFTIGESLHGSAHEGSTIYPQNIALASTFNPSLAYRRATDISGELRYQGIRQVLAPCIDVVRDLRWGRVEECYGEDPFLNGVFACNEVKGYIDNGISPMLKHYGPHGNPTGGLNLASVNCGVGELHDIYLYPFKKVITTLPVHAVMSTYNSWNSEPNSSSHYLLTDVLRNRWGFKGYVYSDWGAINMLHTFHHTASSDSEAAVQALSAGLDVEASSNCYPYLIPLINSQLIDEALVDTAAYRVLLAKFQAGLFEDPYNDKLPACPMHTAENIQLAREIADESTVLLKNDGGLLPLDLSKLKSIAVIGPNADRVQFGDYTWSRNKKDGVTPLDGINNALKGTDIQVNYSDGCDVMSLDTTRIAAAVRASKESDVTVLFCGSASASLARDYSEVNCGEGFDLSDLSLSGVQEQLIHAVASTGKPLVLVLVTGKPFTIAWEKENVPAILAQWYAGEQAGNSIADILFGKVNPSGHLTVSFPQSTGHLPAYYNHLPTDRGFYHQPGSSNRPGRDYVFSSPEPLWAFGHGLSYTSFGYGDIKATVTKDSVLVSLLVKNEGKKAGKAVPQLYVHHLCSSTVMPVKQLKAFSKIALQPSESKRTTLNFALSELAFTDNGGKTALEPGYIELQIGDASDNILLRDTIKIGNPDNRYIISSIPSDKNIVKGNKKSINVTGVVRDAQATPMHGVSITSALQKKVIAVTDNKGKYSVKVQSNDILVFRKRNYQEEKVSVNSNHTVHVTMMNIN
jgi:beta-glucosidase